ncbi:MAG TPA: FAD-dependent oxidoreductase [Syntrophomonas sp.]|nr:FAD-dependent oxidoreductase [Syntrophomonas sp.]
MSVEDKFDAIIVGAGPAGSACAYTLARAGKNVLVIERGDTPGSKNVTGGRLYTYALEMLEPGLWEEAALERKVTHEQIMLLSKDQSVNIDYYNPAFHQKGQVPMSYTVLRANFDAWLANKAEEAGAMVACGIKVDRLIEQDGEIVGVMAGADEMYADVVIAADGVNSFMAQQAGLMGEIRAENVGVGVKEVIELPADVIEQRFHLQEGEGAARMLLGCTEGIHGGGFLYTNQDSVSLGCVFTPQEAGHKKRSVHEIFQELKMHPSIYPLLEGGQTIEYSAHLVGEAGYRSIPKKLYREGFLMVGDAAGFVINTGYSIRGIDLAILSGIAAARGIINADNPAAIGPEYMKQLDNIKLLPTMQAADGYFDLLETPWLYDKVPDLAEGVLAHLFTVTGAVPGKLRKDVMKLIKANDLSFWQLIRLGWKGMKL